MYCGYLLEALSSESFARCLMICQVQQAASFTIRHPSAVPSYPLQKGCSFLLFLASQYGTLNTVLKSYKNGKLYCITVWFAYLYAGVILELSEREKFCANFRISGRSYGPNFGFTHTFYTFSLLPQLKIGRNQPGRLFLPNRPLG